MDNEKKIQRQLDRVEKKHNGLSGVCVIAQARLMKQYESLQKRLEIIYTKGVKYRQSRGHA